MRWIAYAMFSLAIICLPSCSAPQTTIADPLEVAPPDCFIDATVLAAPTSPSKEAARAIHNVPAHLRPGRFVLFADGTLRQGFDPTAERGANWLPPMTRNLTREQTAEVWSLATQLGLTNPEAADPIINPSLVKANPGERVLFIDFRGDGRRWNFIRRASLDEPPDVALAQLLRHLSELSWADQASEPETITIPRRYDFGPDPYERYRNPSSQK